MVMWPSVISICSALNFLSTVTELFRINIFDIVTQYQAIFPEISHADYSDETKSKRSVYETDSKIINSWLVLKIEQYLKILQGTLNGCVEINTTLSLDATIDQIFYFGLTMSKIGADIRPQLILIFNE